MAYATNCSSCGKVLYVKHDVRPGDKMKCHTCGHVTRFVRSGGIPLIPVNSRGKGKSHRGGNGKPKGSGISAGGIFTCLAILGVILWFLAA